MERTRLALIIAIAFTTGCATESVEPTIEIRIDRAAIERALQPVSEITGTLLRIESADYVLEQSEHTIGVVRSTDGGVLKMVPVRLPRESAAPWGQEIDVAGKIDGAFLEITEMTAPETAIANAASLAHSLAVMPVHFLDKNLTRTSDQLADVWFDNPQSIAELYAEASFGNYALTGTVYPEARLLITEQLYRDTVQFPCGYSGTLRPEVFIAAMTFTELISLQMALAGFPIYSHDRRLVVIPKVTCDGNNYESYGGLGGSQITTSLVVGEEFPQIMAHEYGHSIGLQHANFRLIGSGGAVTEIEYGDQWDFMGSTLASLQTELDGLFHLNAPHKMYMGWLAPNNVQTITRSGTYVLENLETATGGLQTLVVPIPGSPEHFYLSYRAPIGFDHNLDPSVANKLSVHMWEPSSNPDFGFLGALLSKSSFFLGALPVGTPSVDPSTGMTLELIAEDGQSAIVEITL